MEINSKPRAKEPGAKPPTRLQKQAPAALQLDQIANAAFDAAASRSCPIPLLSPLILSPQQPAEGEADDEKRLMFMASVNGNDGPGIGGGGNNNNSNLIPTPKFGGMGWQHPAVEAMPDPSELFNFFQSQCVLVNRVQ
ncbi:uncharacterized protein LOC127808024 [Diospyros lotus]|uniref:uncharacterized protein LOC127808024 n=1 Tax=Diospyros lotus TaxID=55363 RepID=UPI002257EBD5|nr:uncharacterized protein LOC127808024 [Diospyros lotus]